MFDCVRDVLLHLVTSLTSYIKNTQNIKPHLVQIKEVQVSRKGTLWWILFPTMVITLVRYNFMKRKEQHACRSIYILTWWRAGWGWFQCILTRSYNYNNYLQFEKGLYKNIYTHMGWSVAAPWQAANPSFPPIDGKIWGEKFFHPKQVYNYNLKTLYTTEKIARCGLLNVSIHYMCLKSR